MEPIQQMLPITRQFHVRRMESKSDYSPAIPLF
jgi:hypothetical protein